MSGLFQQQRLVPSGRSPMAAGAKHSFGLVIKPDQILELLHDFLPGAPIPFDARHFGVEIEDAGVNSKIRFHFQSAVNPLENCLEMDPQHFLRILMRLADGLIPLDSELEGIEVSHRFTLMLLRIKSEHFPASTGNDFPSAYLRYEAGELLLVNPLSVVQKERRILLSDKR